MEAYQRYGIEGTGRARRHDPISGRRHPSPVRRRSRLHTLTTVAWADMARIDYIDDPAAPAINSVVPSVVAVVTDSSDRVLMIHKTDNDLWALPGGGHEPGESIAATVLREVKEETGYDVEVETVTGLYTNPDHRMKYDDGEVRQQFSIAFRAKLIGGEARTSSESREVRWLNREEVDSLDVHPSMRLRLDHALDGRQRPFVG
jgi:8-oxo-dGTP pyrophosphatase MutT (NUDIX family)